jgi:hypothetical protein
MKVKVTLLETFERKWKLLMAGMDLKKPMEFETSQDLITFLKDKGIEAEIGFIRKEIPKEAIISYTPATEWFYGWGRWSGKKWKM